MRIWLLAVLFTKDKQLASAELDCHDDLLYNLIWNFVIKLVLKVVYYNIPVDPLTMTQPPPGHVKSLREKFSQFSSTNERQERKERSIGMSIKGYVCVAH